MALDCLPTVPANDFTPGTDTTKAPSVKKDHFGDVELDGKSVGRFCETNDPHPLLEFPVLYLLLARHFPRALQWVQPLYTIRWRLSYPLAHKIPFSPFLMRRFNLTANYGELLLLIPFAMAMMTCFFYTFHEISVSVTGKIARGSLIAAFVFATRNSLVTLLLGIPIDRTHFYHKLAGKVAAATTLMHTIAFFRDPKFRKIHQNDFLSGALTGQVNISGTFMTVFVAGIAITSLPSVKNKIFEIWHALHQLFSCLLAVGAFFHTGILVPTLVTLTWGLDRAIRKTLLAQCGSPIVAELKTISPSVVEIKFPKTFAYNPGQYVWISIPEITWLQWHPLSICSAPHRDTVTLQVRTAGNWSKAVYNLATTKDSVAILVEGPYGNFSVDILGDRKYKSMMMIGGGIGVTPMQSICDQLLHEAETNHRNLRRIKFIWVDREESLLETSEFIQRPEVLSSVKVGTSDRVALSAWTTENGLFHNSCPEFGATTMSDSEDEEECWGDTQQQQQDRTAVCSQVLDMRLFWTGNSVDFDPPPLYMTKGRPPIDLLFQELKAEAIAAGENKIAVLSSAPRALLNRTKLACMEHSDHQVRFDFHSESIID